jgi:hypothetical protein
MDNIRDYINEENVIKDEIYNNFESSLTCSICSDIIIEPTMCMNCQNVYCKKCIDDWSKKSSKCPNRCQNTSYNKSVSISEILSKLKFICKKCDNIVNYNEMKTHKYNCKRKKTPGENLSKSTIKDNKNELSKINSK